MSQPGYSVSPVSLGRILFKLRGAYSAATAYERMDAVRYGADAYVAMGATKGNLPTNAAYWHRLTDAGTALDAGLAQLSTAVTGANAAASGADAAAGRANAGALAAEIVIGGVQAAALEVAASKWRFYADGNPVTVDAADGSGMRVTADRACTVWQSGKNLSDPSAIAIGSISTASGSTTSNTLRLHTGFLLLANGKIGTMSGAPSTIRIYTYYYYGKNKEYLGYSSTGVPADGSVWMRVVFCNSTSATSEITQDDVDAMRKNYQYEVSSVATTFEPYVAVDAYALTANTPTAITAISGENYLNADASAYLHVEYNRDSMAVFDDLTVPVTASGAVAQIDGCVGGHALEITARAVATQAGTPTPDAPAALNGHSAVSVTRCKTNLGDDALLKANGVPQSDGLYLIAGNKYAAMYGQALFVNPLGLAGQIAVSLVGRFSGDTATGLRLRIVYTDGTFSSVNIPAGSVVNAVVSVVSTATKVVDRVVYNYSSTSVDTYIGQIMVQFDNVASAYEPYVGYTYTATLGAPLNGVPDTPDTYDLTRGRVTRATKRIALTGTTETIAAPSIAPASGYAYSIRVPDAYVAGPSTYGQSLQSTRFTVPSAPSVQANRVPGTAYVYASSTGVQYIHIVVDIPTLQEVKDWLAGLYAAGTPVEFIYRLATPVTEAAPTITIPALSGKNVVFSDAGGDTTATGRMGGAGLLKRIEALEAAVAGI